MVYQNGISELNLIELYATGNKEIKNVNRMKETLKILDCGYGSGIDQNGISELNLIELNVNNKKIKNFQLDINIIKCIANEVHTGNAISFNVN